MADALRRAKDEAPPEPGFWDSLGNALSGMLGDLQSLAGKVWQWTNDHAADIAKVGDIFSKVSAVLGIVALACAPIEPLGAILGAAAGITSLGALATQGLAKAAGANVSWTTLGLDAVGSLPFLGPLAQGTKVATAGIDAAQAASRAANIAGRLGEGVGAADGLISGGKLGPRLLAAGVSKFVNGATIGSGGFNRALGLLDTVGSSGAGAKLGLGGLAGMAGHAIDPASAVARGIDIGIDGTKTAASIGYDALHGSGGNPPPPAGSTFNSRVAARSGT